MAAAAVTAGVVLWTAVLPSPARPEPPSPAQQRALFEVLAREEPSERERAKEDWPHHRWSQQDAFGASEREHVMAVARERNRSPQDLFAVIDLGVRSHWPGPDGQPLEATVVPLQPRPMD